MLYRTQDHDTWDMIAYRHCIDTEQGVSRLIGANSVYADTVFFSAGVILTIPDFVYQDDTNIPPWRR